MTYPSGGHKVPRWWRVESGEWVGSSGSGADSLDFGMTWIWIVAAALVGALGVRHRLRMRAARPRVPRVDDAALESILREGRLVLPEEDEPVDLDEAARAEEEFWGESWDEPEEYSR